ncbi:MAG TPA: hypothetical protein VFG54_09990 [Prolixibacteraceae bacterium]|nr:hypothetical protein [Prolixibacteraceae bacterium]
MQLFSRLIILIVLVSCSFDISSGQPTSSGKDKVSSFTILPEGNNGIAASYPGDKGIASDKKVLFADDFESYQQPLEMDQRWDALYQRQLVGLTKDSAYVYAGKQSLQFTLPQQTAELSDGIDKILSAGQDVLFLRYYSRFHSPYDVIGSSHNGSSISANYMDQGRATPGIPANGTNKFLVNLENWRGDAETPSPGYLNLYVYHPEQRSEYGDHFFPDGIVSPYTSKPYDFGSDFIPRPQIITPLDQWFCYEYMVQANTPGKRDGRIAVWVDGKLVADFMNLRFRDIESLKIDRFGLSFHIKSNPRGEARKWFDNVVAASSYIGPVVPLKE